jgi:DNA-binding response OmpR family regulator
MAKILVVDDDAALLDVLAMALQDAGHTALTASDGRAGLSRIDADRPDLVISDVNMPHVDGFTLCRKLREVRNGVPIVLLTSRTDELDEALGLELGADDYVAKPFSTRVLLARVAALLRRESARNEPPKPLVRVGLLELDAERLEARWNATMFITTVTEFRMVEALARRPGVVFNRDRLMELMRGDDSVVAERIVDTYIKRVRRKIEAIDPAFDRIETVVGAGYRWRS